MNYTNCQGCLTLIKKNASFCTVCGWSPENDLEEEYDNSWGDSEIDFNGITELED